jgi:hypothetical protein
MGEKGFEIPELREYVVLYTNTRKYISMHTSESETLGEMYHRFPEIEMPEFNNKADRIISYILWLFGNFNSRYNSYVRRYREPQEFNPEIKAYYEQLMDKVPDITRLCNEMIDRLAD